MRNCSRIFGLLLIITVMLTTLYGCQLNHFERSEVVEWAESEFDVPVIIDQQYTERVDDEGYTDRVWIAYLESRPDLKFEIISDAHWGMETITHTMDTTYYYVYGQYYFQQYSAEHTTVFTPEKDWQPTWDYRVVAEFDNREQIKDIVSEMMAIGNYMSELGYADCVSYQIRYRDPLAVVNNKTDVYKTFTNDFADAEKKIVDLFALYAADYRLSVDQFTTQELEDIVADSDESFVIVRPDGSEISYPDLTLSRFNYGMSFGTLYEVLTREGFDTVGTPEAFTVTGVDGSVYEFSYAFNDYSFYTDAGLMNGYYYLKDDQRIPMDYYFYNHIRSDLFEQISGMTFEEL